MIYYNNKMDGNIYRCTVSPNVYISNSPLSEWGVFAAKDFKKGDVLYENTAIIIDVNEVPEEIILKTERAEYKLHKIVHPVPLKDNLSILYNFDSFFNHHCDPNTFCTLIDENDPTRFRCNAKKDIKKDEELTCNYNTFYFYDDAPFQCNCGSTNCFGKIGGFKALSLENQKLLIHDLEPYYFKLYNFDHLLK
jgi:SET domain-containing protein